MTPIVIFQTHFSFTYSDWAILGVVSSAQLEPFEAHTHTEVMKCLMPRR